MKTETKDLLDKISRVIPSTGFFSSDELEKFTELKHKIPEAENVLCNGGYILDITRQPCKAGDKVLVEAEPGEWREAYLVWNDRCFCFEVVIDGVNLRLEDYEFERWF